MAASSASSTSTLSNYSPTPSNYRHVFNLFLSLPVLFLLGIWASSTPYAKQGFFCNDNEIRFPDVPDTVSANFMEWVTTIVGTILIISSEFSLIKGLHRQNAAQQCSKLSISSICDLGKRTCSRLRPNFLAVCQPKNLSELCPPGEYGYIQEYECTNVHFDQNEYFSFPSAHAAFICNFSTFMIFYMQKRCKFPAVFRSFIQFFITLFAYFVCLSRVRDHKHRLTDVIGGAATGIALGSFFIRFMLHNFRPNRYCLIDKEWPEEDALINEKFSVPQTIILQHSKSIDESQKMKQNSYQRNSSDYGTLRSSSSSAYDVTDEIKNDLIR
ncbi:acidPPc domain-containing protein [Meloidogyne graminicola]|uniref:AcidPPc domain-containing protein n=1 Tax=Meloidogyne graminicola TaxID=189291 RepID=A0A8S9ZYQ8_9BILA|nr:acidPPc domain-containing protein [Meloidogyne graminicola]